MKKYFMIAKISLINEMQYRVNFFLSLLSAVLPMMMMLFLWTAVYANSSETQHYGYGRQEMLFYTIMSTLLSSLISAGFASDISRDIKSGSLNKFLIMPVGYFLYRLFEFIGQKINHFLMLGSFIIGSIFVMYINNYIEFDYIAVLLFLCSVIMALALNFMLYMLIGLSAFWILETSYLFWALNIFINIISGGLVPLEVFGPLVSNIAKYLPFQYTIFFPVNIICSRITLAESIDGFLISFIWLIILKVINKLLWEKGLKAYVAVGG